VTHKADFHGMPLLDVEFKGNGGAVYHHHHHHHHFYFAIN